MDDNKTDINDNSEVSEAVRKYGQHDKNGRYTYSDYESWDDDKRYELIDGIAYLMSAPTTAHQETLTGLFLQFANFLIGKTCKVFVAPYDVCLSGKGDNDNTVVQPDIFINCDKSKIDAKRCNGAPDLVIEILSPSTARKDRFVKLNKYLEAGVREFWLVDPEYKGVTVHILENGKYIISAYEDHETIEVSILEGCKIKLPEVFV